MVSRECAWDAELWDHPASRRYAQEMGDVDKFFKVIKIMNEKLTGQESEELDIDKPE